MEYIRKFTGRCRVAVVVLSMVSLIGVHRYLSSVHLLLKPGKNYICQTFNGRLGNHIFQYASIFGIARANNLTIILGKDDDLVKYFSVPSAEIRSNRNVCKTFTKNLAKKCCSYEKGLMSLEPGCNYVVGEYLQSWRYFDGLFTDVRYELSFRDPIALLSNSVLNNIRHTYYNSSVDASNVTLVGMHIRRGDMASKEFLLNDSPFMLAPDGYIHRAIDYVLERFRKPVFIVCSDDMTYAYDVTRHRNISVHLFHHSPIQDLAVLAGTDMVITTVGTFSWWVGFLSAAPVIYFRYPIREGSPSRQQYNYADFFPPHWIGLI